MEDDMPDSMEGKGCQSIDSYRSHNGSNAASLCGKSSPLNNCKHESDCRDFPRTDATSETNLIAQEDPFYTDKAITDVKQPQMPVLISTSTIKDICIDEGMQTFEKVLIRYGEVDKDIFTSLNIPRLNGSSMLIEGTSEKENLKDLKPSSTIEGLQSSTETSQGDVGEGEFPSPSKCATNLNETRDKTVKTDLRFFLVNEYPVEQKSSGSSISERRQLDTTESTCIPSQEITEVKSYRSEDFKADFYQVESSSNTESTETQDLRKKIDQVAKEEEVVSDIRDLSEEEKISILSDTVPDGINVSSDYVISHNLASTSNLETGDTSIAGNQNKVMNNRPSVRSQNIGNEERISDGTIEARTSFAHLIHGDPSLLEPSSFSGSISTSTQIPYSGSISFQSESSTTSTHSFAFPVMQPEWSNSPVRMAKANRRHLRKHRWKTKLMCCKF